MPTTLPEVLLHVLQNPVIWENNSLKLLGLCRGVCRGVSQSLLASQGLFAKAVRERDFGIPNGNGWALHGGVASAWKVRAILRKVCMLFTPILVDGVDTGGILSFTPTSAHRELAAVFLDQVAGEISFAGVSNDPVRAMVSSCLILACKCLPLPWFGGDYGDIGLLCRSLEIDKETYVVWERLLLRHIQWRVVYTTPSQCVNAAAAAIGVMDPSTVSAAERLAMHVCVRGTLWDKGAESGDRCLNPLTIALAALAAILKRGSQLVPPTMLLRDLADASIPQWGVAVSAVNKIRYTSMLGGVIARHE